MAQEKAIRLLPLTQKEVEALTLALNAIILSRMDEKIEGGIAKALWQSAMSHIRGINEKLNKGVNNGRN